MRCLWLRNQRALKRLRTLKTDGWSTMGADAVDAIAGGEMTLRDDGGKGPRRMKKKKKNPQHYQALLCLPRHQPLPCEPQLKGAMIAMGQWQLDYWRYPVPATPALLTLEQQHHAYSITTSFLQTTTIFLLTAPSLSTLFLLSIPTPTTFITPSLPSTWPTSLNQVLFPASQH